MIKGEKIDATGRDKRGIEEGKFRRTERKAS